MSTMLVTKYNAKELFRKCMYADIDETKISKKCNNCKKECNEKFCSKNCSKAFKLLIKETDKDIHMRYICNNCGKTDNLRKCSRCLKVYYCSDECNKAKWKIHKKDCNKKTIEPKPEIFKELETKESFGEKQYRYKIRDLRNLNKIKEICSPYFKSLNICKYNYDKFRENNSWCKIPSETIEENNICVGEEILYVVVIETRNCNNIN